VTSGVSKKHPVGPVTSYESSKKRLQPIGGNPKSKMPEKMLNGGSKRSSLLIEKSPKHGALTKQLSHDMKLTSSLNAADLAAMGSVGEGQAAPGSKFLPRLV